MFNDENIRIKLYFYTNYCIFIAKSVKFYYCFFVFDQPCIRSNTNNHEIGTW